LPDERVSQKAQPLAKLPASEYIRGSLYGLAYVSIWAVVSTCLYGRAVSILGASNGSAFAALAPAMTALVAIPLLGEWPATSDWIAMVLISGGVYIASGAPLPARWAGHEPSVSVHGEP
jgi:drug/metabolite transporter (DMT)-like permease